MYFVYRQHWDLKYWFIGIFVCYLISNILITTIRIPSQQQYKVVVKNHIKIEDKTSFYGTTSNQKVVVYLNSNIKVSPGDVLLIEGELMQPISNTVPHTFDYQQYLHSLKIDDILYADNEQNISHKFVLDSLPYHINHYIETYMPSSKGYVKTFILADKSEFDQTFLSTISLLGISHLFAVSGLHVGLVILVLKWTMRQRVSTHKQDTIIFVFLLLYLVVTSFTPSVLRASLLYIIYTMSKRLKLDLSSLDILSIIFIFYVLYNPYIFYNLGFTLSFLVTYSILLGQYLINMPNKIKQVLVITIIAFITTMPIVLFSSKQINLLSIVLNVFFVYYMTLIILPFGYMTFVYYILDFVYGRLILVFEACIFIAGSIDFFVIKITFVNHLQVVIYYSLLILLLMVKNKERQKKLFSAFVIFFFISYFINNVNFMQQVSVIDVYGDSILIQDRFNQCNILIDTGDADEYDTVINYIKGENIRRIDYVIITHFHDDHIGELDDILSQFNVKNVITNQTLFSHTQLSCGNYLINFYLTDTIYENENNNSLVFDMVIGGKQFLFTGDIEEIREAEVLSQIQTDYDYLKSSHHGSKTSSSLPFLNHLKIENALITSYRNNLHGHPSPQVIKEYQERNININRIDIDGTIELYYLFGFEYKKTHQP